MEPVGKASVAKLIPMPEVFSSNFKGVLYIITNLKQIAFYTPFMFLDLFADLLPVSVHQALSSYEVRRNELVNSEISKLREMTQILNGYDDYVYKFS